MNPNANTLPRVIGLDSHPDSFTAAMVRGSTPASAITEKIYNKIPIAQLQNWARKHTRSDDLFLLEASGNSFQIVRTLARLQRKALVLESCHLGLLKEAHANNDKISAVRIAKAYLAGTAKTVWIPDPQTQERRDWFHAYIKKVRRTTQLRSRLRSYLSDNGVRLPDSLPWDDPSALEATIRPTRSWSPRQWQVIQGLLMELRHAQEQRTHWRSLMAQEVMDDPLLLSLVRLCGVRDVTAFALGAILGDIKRFASPKKLVSYIGLHPAFDQSGENSWQGGLSGHGRSDLRTILIEAAHSILRSAHPIGRWGRKLLARKGEINLVIAAVARKLAVAIWYLLMGRWPSLEQIDTRLQAKLGTILHQVGPRQLKTRGKTRSALLQEMAQKLKTGRVYVLHSHPTAQTPTFAA
jgi:transposase